MSSTLQEMESKLQNIMNNWCQNHRECFEGGKMRGDRGDMIEEFVIYVIEQIAKEGKTREPPIDIHAIKGSNDKKTLNIPGTNLTKDHQVDVHVYKNDQFIAVIECKAYLDSCYYTRACNDFALFKKFGYHVTSFLFALEDSIKEETKQFTDYETDYICNDIFFLLDGKRSSSKPIYDEKYKKPINKEKFARFVNTLRSLLLD